ncbi:hypothetical protein Ocin01_06771 [Orchesella cincta]|uniref:Secreted protein n=1 Tax=Orchesella cincta TaxID=48709 RepID=A0A1D2N3P6_ORCCI|nr:hypothetical protein Ocin01_06771 [Orchesella cincta]
MHLTKLLFQVITLIAAMSNCGAHNGQANCQNITCEDPPKTASCYVVEPSDTSIPRPQGKYADCCPLWKCKEANKKDFFTFHGLIDNTKKNRGGNEIVSYGSTLGNGADDILNVVSSLATGNHAAFAFASSDGSPPPNTKDLFAEFEKAFKGFSFK